jgi:hypothetical protein
MTPALATALLLACAGDAVDSGDTGAPGSQGTSDAETVALDAGAAVSCVNSLATTSGEAWEAGTTQARREAVTTCP